MTFSCLHCGKEFTQKGHLKLHVQSVHENLKYQGPTKTHLKIYFDRMHEGIKHPCTQCEYQATDKNGLRRHVNSVPLDI